MRAVHTESPSEACSNEGCEPIAEASRSKSFHPPRTRVLGWSRSGVRDDRDPSSCAPPLRQDEGEPDLVRVSALKYLYVAVQTIRMMEVVLRLRMPDGWVGSVCRDLPTPIRFVECKPSGDGGGRGLLEIVADEEPAAEVIRAISEHPDVCKVEFTPISSGRFLGSVETSRCAACQALSGSECFLTSARCIGDGRVEWRLITGAEGSFTDLLERLEERGCEIELQSTTRLDRRALLTERQETVIRLAVEKGYYDQPKRVTIRDLAEAFDISPSTLAEILQRAEGKVMRTFFRERG